MKRARFAKVDFYLRRLSGIVLAVFLGSFLSLLARAGRGIFLGDVGRAGGRPFVALEIALIALMTYHASSGLGRWLLERLGTTRGHDLSFVTSVVLAVGVAVWHVPYLFGWP
ncbi:MAG: hypothetical protein JNL21_00390 [Myxococcales bacterium]|nr:hypothetical protein [Myxococcales bacterium]